MPPELTSQRPGTKERAAPRHARRSAVQRAFSHAWVRHVVLLIIYLGAGIAVTWPRFTWLAAGKMPDTSDESGFVWDLWWVARQLSHGANPFFTTYMAAPAGTPLGFSTLMPLAGWIMAPVTILFGPSAALTLLTIVTPGLLCYAMYRMARLWLNEPGAIVAGAFFGLSSMLMWQNWYHVNISLGTIFLPVVIEAAVRFRRGPRIALAVVLGLALGASVLVNQESTAVAVILAVVILVPWLVTSLIRNRPVLRRALKPLAIGLGLGLVVAGPELLAIHQAIAVGGVRSPPGQLAMNYAAYAVQLPTPFAPSPRLSRYGLGHLAAAYGYTSHGQTGEGVPTYGIVLSALAVLGIIAGWRKRSTWSFAGLWLIGTALALGPSLSFGTCQVSSWRHPGRYWGASCHQYLPLLTHSSWIHAYVRTGPKHHVWKPVSESNLMPYTWLVRLPGLQGFREADRLAIVGLIGAAMLAGLAVQKLSARRITVPLIAVVLGLGALEAGWSGASASWGYAGVMRTTVPQLERILSRDHSGSIVVDFPYGLRGGVDITGSAIEPRSMLLATADGHPRASSYTSWVPESTIKAIGRHPFFRYLYAAQSSRKQTAADLRRATADVATLHIGWVVMWRNLWTMHKPRYRYGHVGGYLLAVGFRRFRVICLPGIRPGHQCGWHRQVWLYRYMGQPLRWFASRPHVRVFSSVRGIQSRTPWRP
jgi:hypothetical protein